MAKLLLEWSDPADRGDPDIFTAAIIAVLSGYPLDVQRRVADPRVGAVAAMKRAAFERREYVAFVELVRRACEDIHGPMRRAIEWEERSRRQLLEREAFDAIERPKQTYPEFLAEMAARGLPIEGKARAVPESANAFCARMGISREAFNALPDLPIGHEDRWANRR